MKIKFFVKSLVLFCFSGFLAYPLSVVLLEKTILIKNDLSVFLFSLIPMDILCTIIVYIFKHKKYSTIKISLVSYITLNIIGYILSFLMFNFIFFVHFCISMSGI